MDDGIEPVIDIETHEDATAVRSIAQAARDAVAGGGASDELREAIRNATPDDRSAAAKELADEMPALELLHRTLESIDLQA